MAESSEDRTASRSLCFRFDVDTYRCVRDGTPALLELATEIDARFTFFVNMGRSVARAETLRRWLSPEPAGPATAEKMTPLRKLGPAGWAATALLDPEVGAGHLDVLERVRDEGHELGLHGGRNHGTWQAQASDWAPDRVAREVRAGLQPLRRLLGRTPAGFSSPGWVSPEGLPQVLAGLGFEYVADRHGEGEGVAGVAEAPGLAAVATNVTGEPGGVAYLEHSRARGLTEGEIVDDFVGRLEGIRSLAVVYDHPCYAGVHDLGLVAALIGAARARGFRIVTLAEAVREASEG